MTTPVTAEMFPAEDGLDFRELASRALEAGLFADRTYPQDQPAGDNNDTFAFPKTMLDAAYGNGPLRIVRNEQDVPTAVMHCVRKNFVEATKLLLPQESVMHYFHNRFVQDDVFTSSGVEQVVADFKPFIDDRMDAPDSALSFVTEGVDRSVKQRNLFTNEERYAAVELARDHPELALTLFAYQGILGDYIQGLHQEFKKQPVDSVNRQDLENFTAFAEQWGGFNFQSEFLPSIALFLTQAKRASPDASPETHITQSLFSDAVQFIIKNGSFRNHVTVPADVAADGVERVNRFSCPAIGTIREQLADGSLLHTIYQVTTKHIGAEDWAALRLSESIKASAEKTIAKEEEYKLRARKQAEEDALPFVVVETAEMNLSAVKAAVTTKILLKQKPANFTFEGVDYFITPEDVETKLLLNQPKQDGDEEVELFAGDYYYRILEECIDFALTNDRVVFFSFNERNNRIDPQNLRNLWAN